jgi:hypothetical protein
MTMTQNRNHSDRFVHGWRNLHAVDTRSQAATGTTRRFETILAIHHGEVYVRSGDVPGSGWLVRFTAGPYQPARALQTAA